jgi:hypothetical protein
MPPSLVVLALVAVAVPAASRAVFGRPRLLLAASIASAIAVVIAQALGELARLGVGVAGDAQLGAAAVASALATALVALVERSGARRRRADRS